jgi:ATP-binding cassette subfamily F protein uup
LPLIALAAALAQDADVLLLDEPTNHLDWEAIDWLVDFLCDPRRTKELSLLLVTHDRSFLERTCSEILELDSAAVYSYQTDGSYETFLRRREERLAADEADLGRQQKILKREVSNLCVPCVPLCGLCVASVCLSDAH